MKDIKKGTIKSESKKKKKSKTTKMAKFMIRILVNML